LTSSKTPQTKDIESAIRILNFKFFSNFFIE